MQPQIRSGALFAAVLFSLFVTGPAVADYVKPNIQHAPFGEVKVVVPITSGDAAVWKFRLRNLANGAQVTTESGGVVQSKVVLYGAGVKMLAQPMDPELKTVIDAARAVGVQINVCNFSLKGMNQDWHELYGVKESDVVPSGFAEVSWLGNHGWAVNPAN